jgi:hypothetical protein
MHNNVRYFKVIPCASQFIDTYQKNKEISNETTIPLNPIRSIEMRTSDSSFRVNGVNIVSSTQTILLASLFEGPIQVCFK